MSTTKGSTGACGCCERGGASTPLATANRPGLDALDYRVGTHAAFLASMTARLSTVRLDELDPEQNPLAGLTTRSSDDPSMALLDAWATAADVLTFYQERIANEGYLRTATERKSLVELARLVGYTPRPGVAASVELAFAVDEGYRVEIPAGTRAQSIPAEPEELPQFFETGEPLQARSEWNEIKPRLTQPQKIDSAKNALYFKGTATNLKPGDRLLIDLGATQSFVQVAAVEEQPADDPTKGTDRTKVTLVPPPTVSGLQVPAPAVGQPLPTILHAASLRELVNSISGLGALPENELTGRLRQLSSAFLMTFRALAKMPPSPGKSEALRETLSAVKAARATATQVERGSSAGSLLARHFAAVTDWLERAERSIGGATHSEYGAKTTPLLDGLVEQLLKPTPPEAIPPSNASRLPRDLDTTFAGASDAGTKLLTQLQPALQLLLYEAWGKAVVTEPSPVKVYALRTQAAVFGHNAPLRAITDAKGVIVRHEEWPLRRRTGVVTEALKLSVEFKALLEDVGSAEVTVELGGVKGAGTVRLEDGAEATVELEYADEQVTVTATVEMKDDAPFKMNLEFSRGRIELTLSVDKSGTLTVSSTGGDPATVTITFGQARLAHGGQSGLPAVQLSGSVAFGGTEVNTEDRQVISLDAPYPAILPQSWVVVDRPGETPLPLITQARTVGTRSRADYGIAGKVTEVELDEEWLNVDADGHITDDFGVIRGTTVFAQSELLELADAPVDTFELTEPDMSNRIELDGLYDGLEAGRWLIVSGERTDIEGVTGVRWSELVMLAGVDQTADEKSRGGKTHSTLVLANTLAYKYKRDTVTIYGNVVKATHGESRTQVLGSGDARESGQTFPLAFEPLTFLAAPTAKGAESTLAVRVNEVLWPESDSPVALGPDDRGYYTRTDDEDNVSVVFGGVCLPTGVENVSAEYRQGIGHGGNVDAEQISLLATQPLGVSKVINPLRASGGADPDDPEAVRRNAPLEVMALDRLVSVQDYADFARGFAGIAKADARRLSIGRRNVIHLTIAAVDDGPIDDSSDLFRNLHDALRLQGDPHVPVEVAARELLLLVIVANVRVLPDYRWESVEPGVRTALLDTFSFDRRNLRQDVVLGDVIGTIHNVEGVQYVDVDVLSRVAQNTKPSDLPGLVEQLRSNDQSRVASLRARLEDSELKPAQLAYLSPDVPDTLLLQEIQG